MIRARDAFLFGRDRDVLCRGRRVRRLGTLPAPARVAPHVDASTAMSRRAVPKHIQRGAMQPRCVLARRNRAGVTGCGRAINATSCDALRVSPTSTPRLWLERKRRLQHLGAEW